MTDWWWETFRFLGGTRLLSEGAFNGKGDLTKANRCYHPQPDAPGALLLF